MPRYDAFTEQPQPPSLTRGWFISALTGSLVVHAGLAIFFQFKTLENFGPPDMPPPKPESPLHRVKVIDDKPKKDEVKTVLPEKKTPEKKRELTLPAELPKPDEISISTKHKEIDTSKLLPDERPAEILIGRYEGRRLKVYVEIDRTPTYVKTVCWTRRI